MLIVCYFLNLNSDEKLVLRIMMSEALYTDLVERW